MAFGTEPVHVAIPPARAEEAEAETFVATEIGAPILRIGGGVALSMPDDRSGFWNVVAGLGFTEPITELLIRRIIDFYRARGDVKLVADAELVLDHRSST